MKKYHQNISIDGRDISPEYANRKHSVFFNEGKWQHFIEPLLPADATDMTFVDIGCNVGLYLRLAKEHGFRNVVGVERDPVNCRMAEKYREYLGSDYDYKILNRSVGDVYADSTTQKRRRQGLLDVPQLDVGELPAADVVLLSNVHYHIHMSEFLPLIDRLRSKAVMVLVVTRRHHENHHGYPLTEPSDVRLLFKDWTFVPPIIHTTREMLDDDPHPRRVNSMSFASGLKRLPITFGKRTETYGMAKQEEYIEIAKSKEAVSLRDTMNWKYWEKRKQQEKKNRGRWSDEEIRDHMLRRINLAKDLIENGQKEPVISFANGVGIDGTNRAQLMKLLGYESIITRVI